MLTNVALTVFAAGAALQDLWKDKIYNKYLLPGMMAGALITLAVCGPRVLCLRLAAMPAALLLLLPLYLINALGAGDVKFLTVMMMFLPMGEWLLVTGGALLIAAVYGAGKLLWKRSLHGRVHFAVPVFASVLFLQGVQML